MREHIIVPTDRNLRFHHRLAVGWLAASMVLSALAVWALVVSGKPPAAIGLMSCLVGTGLSVVQLRGIATTLRVQVRRLASHGRRFPATGAAVQRMRRGGLTYFNIVVAQFRDDRGGIHEALSETFDYDPTPLLRDRPVEVVADPFEPELCVIANDTLPPHQRRRLSPGDRGRLYPADPLQRLIWIVAMSLLAAMLVVLAVLFWKLAAGV